MGEAQVCDYDPPRVAIPHIVKLEAAINYSSIFLGVRVVSTGNDGNVAAPFRVRGYAGKSLWLQTMTRDKKQYLSPKRL